MFMRIANSLPPTTQASKYGQTPRFGATIANNQSEKFLLAMETQGKLALRNGFTGINPIIDNAISAKAHDFLTDLLSPNIRNIVFNRKETAYIKDSVKVLKDTPFNNGYEEKLNAFMQWMKDKIDLAN